MDKKIGEKINKMDKKMMVIEKEVIGIKDRTKEREQLRRDQKKRVELWKKLD